MSSSIGIFSFARKQSQRCPNKMLRPFGGTTLTDVMLMKLASFGERAFFAGFEHEFKEKCQEHSVRFVQRNERSAHIDGPIVEILSFLKEVPCEYFLIVNACLPFLRIATIDNFVVHCTKNGYRPCFGVIQRNNFFMSLDRKPLNFELSLKTINTKAVDPVYEFAHALYFFNKEYFFREGRYWDWKEVDLFSIDNKIELIDIDTEEDFVIAENMWKTIQKEGVR